MFTSHPVLRTPLNFSLLGMPWFWRWSGYMWVRGGDVPKWQRAKSPKNVKDPFTYNLPVEEGEYTQSISFHAMQCQRMPWFQGEGVFFALKMELLVSKVSCKYLGQNHISRARSWGIVHGKLWKQAARCGGQSRALGCRCSWSSSSTSTGAMTSDKAQ